MRCIGPSAILHSARCGHREVEETWPAQHGGPAGAMEHPTSTRVDVNEGLAVLAGCDCPKILYPSAPGKPSTPFTRRSGKSFRPPPLSNCRGVGRGPTPPGRADLSLAFSPLRSSSRKNWKGAFTKFLKFIRPIGVLGGFWRWDKTAQRHPHVLSLKCRVRPFLRRRVQCPAVFTATGTAASSSGRLYGDGDICCPPGVLTHRLRVFTCN
jgi:hypothetical protein